MDQLRILEEKNLLITVGEIAKKKISFMTIFGHHKTIYFLAR